MSVAEQIIESLATGTRPAPQVVRSIRVYPILVDGHQRRMVECAECFAKFAVSSRAIRLARSQGRLLYCATCRQPPKIEVTTEIRSFWLEAMTLEQIVELAEMIWGPRTGWM